MIDPGFHHRVGLGWEGLGWEELTSPCSVNYRTWGGSLDRLLNALTDRDERTRATIVRLVLRHKLSEGDLAWALECATGPGVESPTRVAVAELRKRGELKLHASPDTRRAG